MCVSAAAWRPKVEVGEGGSPPSILPHPLECMVRRARDRCNLRLMRDAAVSRSCADKRRLATKGDEGEVPPQPPFSPGLLEGGELPAIPLSIIELGGESKGSPARKGVEGGGRIALVAPEGEGICCVNDSRIPLLLRRSDALGEVRGNRPIEVKRQCIDFRVDLDRACSSSASFLALILIGLHTYSFDLR